jgi:hypothetical protein
MGITPVHFFSHGSTMMLGEESESATYWKKCGDEALANNIKGVIIMVNFPSFPYLPSLSPSIRVKLTRVLREHTGQPSTTRSASPITQIPPNPPSPTSTLLNTSTTNSTPTSPPLNAASPSSKPQASTRYLNQPSTGSTTPISS